MNIIQDRVRGARPQRTPIEIIITVPHDGLHGSSEPSDLAMMADDEIIVAATARRYCCDAGVVVAHADGQPTRTTASDVGQRSGLAALHDAHAALAITANTNASKWTGEPIDYARCIDYLV